MGREGKENPKKTPVSRAVRKLESVIDVAPSKPGRDMEYVREEMGLICRTGGVREGGPMGT